MKQNRKKKTLIIVLAVLICLALGVDLAASNFLVTYAVGRAGDGANRQVALDVQGPTTELEARIAENYAVQKERNEAFLEAVPERAISLTSQDGLELKGFLYENEPDSHLWAITIHGYRGNHKGSRTFAERFYSEGFHVLAPDLRGCGESAGQFVGMGWPDRLDVLDWIDWIIARDAQAQIVVVGISMGGATTMMVSGEETPDNVVAFVEDCGYTSVWDIFSSELRLRFHLPEMPMLYTASMVAKLRAGYGFKEASSEKQVAKCEKPMLFIHGSEDNFVPYEMLQRVYDAKVNGDKKMVTAEGAGHGQASDVLGEEYWEIVFDFLSQYLPLSAEAETAA